MSLVLCDKQVLWMYYTFYFFVYIIPLFLSSRFWLCGRHSLKCRLTNGLWDCCKQIRAINTQDMGNNQEARRLDKRRKCGQYVDTWVCTWLLSGPPIGDRPNPLLPEDKDTTSSCHVAALCVFITHTLCIFLPSLQPARRFVKSKFDF